MSHCWLIWLAAMCQSIELDVGALLDRCTASGSTYGVNTPMPSSRHTMSPPACSKDLSSAACYCLQPKTSCMCKDICMTYRFLHTHFTSSKKSLGCCNTTLTCRCVREVYGIAKTNWDAFIGPDIVDLYGHLLIYPMVVNQDGRCTHLPSQFWLSSALCQPIMLDIAPMPWVICHHLVLSGISVPMTDAGFL